MFASIATIVLSLFGILILLYVLGFIYVLLVPYIAVRKLKKGHDYFIKIDSEEKPGCLVDYRYRIKVYQRYEKNAYVGPFIDSHGFVSWQKNKLQELLESKNKGVETDYCMRFLRWLKSVCVEPDNKVVK